MNYICTKPYFRTVLNSIPKYSAFKTTNQYFNGQTSYRQTIRSVSAKHPTIQLGTLRLYAQRLIDIIIAYAEWRSLVCYYSVSGIGLRETTTVNAVYWERIYIP